MVVIYGLSKVPMMAKVLVPILIKELHKTHRLPTSSLLEDVSTVLGLNM